MHVVKQTYRALHIKLINPKMGVRLYGNAKHHAY
jgi:hypothetical protein